MKWPYYCSMKAFEIFCQINDLSSFIPNPDSNWHSTKCRPVVAVSVTHFTATNPSLGNLTPSQPVLYYLYHPGN